MWTPEYFVRYVEFPLSVEAVTLPNDDGTFDIYINNLMPEEKQKEKLEHEIRHIIKDHFYSEKPVAVCENEANGKKTPDRLPDIFIESPPGIIPFFPSLEAFGRYMFAMRDQYQKENAAQGSG